MSFKENHLPPNRLSCGYHTSLEALVLIGLPQAQPPTWFR